MVDGVGGSGDQGVTDPSPELIAKMHDAIVLRARLPLVEQRAKRAAHVAQDLLDAQAARYAELIAAVQAVIYWFDSVDGDDECVPKMAAALASLGGDQP